MPVLLKVMFPKAGTTYPPVEPVPVNSSKPNKVKNEHFEGEISLWIKNYNGLKNKGEEDEYFSQPGREGSTYAIVIKGKYLDAISADELLFGNVFEKPVRASLPWGTSIAMKFINWVDPTVEMDPYADKPWALSPLLASMNYLSVHKKGSEPTPHPTVTEASSSSLSTLYESKPESVTNPSDDPTEWEDGTQAGINARRKWLTKKGNRESIMIDKNWEIGCEFGNGLVDFSTLHVVLPHPFPLRIPLLKYWDGQPATYICKSRDGKKIYWSVAIQIETVDDTDYKEAEEEDIEAENAEAKDEVMKTETPVNGKEGITNGKPVVDTDDVD